MAMADDFKVDALGDLILKFLDAVVFEFVNAAALDANHVIVMIAGLLEERFPFPKMPLVSQAAFLEQHQGTVDGDVTDRRLDFFHLIEKLLNLEMLV